YRGFESLSHRQVLIELAILAPRSSQFNQKTLDETQLHL
ncbi:MAG: hypothetical protein RL180_1430, partial [Pseudomonadota bacterium]